MIDMHFLIGTLTSSALTLQNIVIHEAMIKQQERREREKRYLWIYLLNISAKDLYIFRF